MSQCTEIIAYMKEHGSITSREAMLELDCGRLASRINELRHNRGYRIVSVVEERINSKGVKKRYTRYFLETVFCIDCGEHQPYTVQTVTEELTMPDGSTRCCAVKKAVCGKCGSEVYVADVNDWNCWSRERAYENYRWWKNCYEGNEGDSE